MQHHFLASGCKKRLLLAALTILPFLDAGTPAWAVTRFAPDMKKKVAPAPIDVDRLWFYDSDHAKVIPELDPTWIAVVFRPSLFESTFDDRETPENEARLRSAARGLVEKYDEAIDYFCDSTLAQGACFLQLSDDMNRGKIPELIARINAEDTVAYAHPTIRSGDSTYAFFNALKLEWKDAVDQGQKDLLLSQAAASYDPADAVYRIDIFRMPFMTAVNLLAEDIRVAKASPYLVTLERSIQADVTLAMTGCSMGERIPFVFKVVFSDRVRLDPGSIANINLRPFEVQKELFEVHIEPYDYVKVAGHSPVTVTGWLSCYAPGDFAIPPVTIRYSCPECSGTQDRSIATRAVAFRVSSIVPPKEPGSSLIIPMDLKTPDYGIQTYHQKSLAWLLRAVLSFVVALGCIVWLIGRYYRDRQQAIRLRAQTQKDIIADQIRRFLQQEPEGAQWSYLAEGSRLVRAYVTARYRLTGVPPGGSGEVFVAAIGSQVPESLATILRRVLTRTDEAVALESHPVPDLDAFRADVTSIIDFPATQ